MFGIKRATVPTFELSMLLVLWIIHGVEEQFEAGNAANILGGSATCPVDIARIFDSGIGVRDRLDRDRVLPVVAEVVGVRQLHNVAIDERAEPHGLRAIGSVTQAFPFGIGDGVALSVNPELEKVTIIERHGRLDDIMQGLERCRQWHLDAPPYCGLPIIKLDFKAGYAVDIAHAAKQMFGLVALLSFAAAVLALGRGPGLSLIGTWRDRAGAGVTGGEILLTAPHLAEDMGLTLAEMEAEAAKRLWQP
jgi:hypothetical protein